MSVPAVDIFYCLAGPRPRRRCSATSRLATAQGCHSLMPSSASSIALADRHSRRRHYCLVGPHIVGGGGAPPPPSLLGDFAPRNSSGLSLADAVVCKLYCACRPAGPQAPLLSRGAPHLWWRRAPPPPSLLGDFAPRNSSGLSLADAASAS